MAQNSAITPAYRQPHPRRRLANRSLYKPDLDVNPSREDAISVATTAVEALTRQIVEQKIIHQQMKSRLYEIQFKFWTTTSFSQSETLQKQINDLEASMNAVRGKLKTLRGHAGYYKRQILKLNELKEQEDALSLLSSVLARQDVQPAMTHPPILSHQNHPPTGGHEVVANLLDNKHSADVKESNPATETGTQPEDLTQGLIVNLVTQENYLTDLLPPSATPTLSNTDSTQTNDQ